MSAGNFEKKYAGLNTAQKQAVDCLEGPVMVVAGPGTGKTELLSVRVANILKRTDSLAENILCLTFTESGATAMRERLTELMGKDAYRVGVYTFHGFGSEIINSYNQYFYSGAQFRPADELSTHQILTDIFESLPHTNPLSSKMNGEFSYLKMVQHTISDFKKAGLAPDEVQRLVRHNQGFVEFAEPIVAKFFAAPMHKSMLGQLDNLYNDLAAYQSLPTDVANTEPLSELFLHGLKAAIEQAHADQKVTGITAWRNRWCEKNKTNQFVFKDSARGKKLLAASTIYNDYLNAMQAAALYDYDDMILRLVHALEVFPELKFNLQEQYQYILVDEFQDTNGAQMRIVLSLTDNPVSGGKPNVLVVGDDDQAIYSFQGAELSNLLSFQKRFAPTLVNLRENYRSAPTILEHARGVITQSAARLETTLADVNKLPLPQVTDAKALVQLTEHASPASEYNAVAKTIHQKIKAGQTPGTIAVLARNHGDIQKLLPYLNHHEVAFSYEHQDDILQTPAIKALVDLARVVTWLSHGTIERVNAALPELLASPAWGCTAQELWQLSLAAYTDRTSWLEVMQQSDGRLGEIAQFLITTSYSLEERSFEENIDHLYGLSTKRLDGDEFISPLGEYFFPSSITPENPRELIKNIHALEVLRRQLRDYRPDQPLHIHDFVEFIDKLQAARIRLKLQVDAEPDSGAVLIMTAHKAKGREFDSVFIVNATDTTWGSKSRGRPSRLSYPANLPIAPPGETEDERLRLFFVAMTRAKRELMMSYASHNDAGKPNLRADFLHTDDWSAGQAAAAELDLDQQRQTLEISWRDHVTQPSTGLKIALAPILRDYQLSVTHLNSFLNVTRGGPRQFLLNNLLRFPRSRSPQEALGSAVHSTLKQAHDHFSATTEPKPLEDVLYDFETNLAGMRLNKTDFAYQLQKGSDALQAYLAKAYGGFSPEQVAERNFHHQGITIDGVKLTGIVDVLRPDRASKTITVTDYKTGKPARKWGGTGDFEKIKLHQYKQQLIFYKLLIESSNEFRGYTVDRGVLAFVEPDEHGELLSLELDYRDDDIETFKQLMQAVWHHIMQADFPDTSGYPETFKGVVAFENDLLEA